MVSSGDNSLARALHSEADQLSMFGADASPEELDALRGPDGRLPSNAFRQLRARNGKRGPGRPLGAVNKRSEGLAKLVIQQYGDPVLGGAALYGMPLDQLCEMLLVADGSQERAEQTDELTRALAVQVAELGEAVHLAAKRGDVADLNKAADRLADAAESLENVSKSSGKAGALALQALNVQLMARRFVAEYVHSKRPVAVEVSHKTDGVLVMPRTGGGDDAAFVRDKLGGMMAAGRIEADQVARLELRDGRLHDPDGEIADAEFDEIAVDEGDSK